MDPRLRTALSYTVASVIAAFVGWQIAEANYSWASMLSIGLFAAIMMRVTGLAADVIFIGLLIVGYIVGNRGFAQLTLAPGLFLLPGEAGLLMATGWRLIVWGFERQLPIRPDALNWTIVAWLVVGTARVMFDIPEYGLLAVRDYAMVYYAAFFFIAQHMAKDPQARRFLIACLKFALLVLFPVRIITMAFPEFFMTQLTIRGAPIIYHKGDLAYTFLAVGALVTFHAAKGNARYWAWPVAAAMFLYVAAADNRASLAGAAIASILLLVNGHWKFPAIQASLAAIGLSVMLLLATVADHSWSEGKLAGIEDRIRSMMDLGGTKTYVSEESSFKGDNNRFRLVWWRNVVRETWQTNPAFGLGFGADLARGFVQEYYPEMDEEFGVRSPHNFFVTTFGRMGLAGLLVGMTFCAAFTRAAWRAVRENEEPTERCLWCALVMILFSASVGVVLEGPMGAVIFWTILGVAHGASLRSSEAAVSARETNPRENPKAPLPVPATGVL